MSKLAFATGKRKLAKARAVIKETSGAGRVRINGEPLSKFSPLIQMMIQEPLLLAEMGNGLDISVNVNGG